MSDQFIKSLAERRAKELFTKEFFLSCTDSWYGDEELEFESYKVGVNERHPTPEEINKYMAWLQEFKDSYQDSFYGIENAVCAYSAIIDNLRDIVDSIEEFKNKYKEFECPADISLKLKEAGNYFVNIHNELLPIYNEKVEKLNKENDKRTIEGEDK